MAEAERLARLAATEQRDGPDACSDRGHSRRLFGDMTDGFVSPLTALWIVLRPRPVRSSPAPWRARHFVASGRWPPGASEDVALVPLTALCVFDRPSPGMADTA